MGQNKKRVYELNGEMHTLSEWSKISGIRYHLLYQRIVTRGWDIERALSEKDVPRRDWTQEDLTGQRFGHLVVIGRASKESCKRYWVCKCDCGREAIYDVYRLRKGMATTCGVDCKYHMTFGYVARRYRYKGETRTVKEWSEVTGIPPEVIHRRLRLWGSISKALEEPLRGRDTSNGKV